MPKNLLTVAALSGLVLFSASACAQNPAAIPANLQPEVARVFEKVSPDSIRAVMSVLASDELEGRQPGTRGFARASEYVQNKLKAMGLQPGVGGSSYVQPLLFKKGVVTAATSSFVLLDGPRAQGLVYGKDFLLHPYFYSPTSSVTAPIVFVGYGVYAPELQYHDYGGTALNGKIVVFFPPAPPIFPSHEPPFFPSPPPKLTPPVNQASPRA